MDEIEWLIDDFPALKALGKKWHPLTSEEQQSIEKFKEGILISLNCKDLHDVHNRWLSHTYYKRLNKAYENLGLGFRGNWYLIYPTIFRKKDIDELDKYFRTHIYSPSKKATRYFMSELHFEFTSRMSLSDFNTYSKLWFNLFGDMSTEQIREYISNCLQEINNAVVTLCKNRNYALLKKKCAKIDKLKQKEFARMQKAKIPKKLTIYDKYDKNKPDEDSENYPSLISQLEEAHEYYKKCDLFIEKNLKDTEKRHIDLSITQEDMQNLKTAEKFLLEYPIEKWDELFPEENYRGNDRANEFDTNNTQTAENKTATQNIQNDDSGFIVTSREESEKALKEEKIRKEKQIAYLLNNALEEIEKNIPFINAQTEMVGIEDKPFLQLFDLTQCAVGELRYIFSGANNPKLAIDMFINTLESISSATKGKYYVNGFVHAKGIKRAYVGLDFSHENYDKNKFYSYYLYFRRKKGTNCFEILHIICTYQPYIDSLVAEMKEKDNAEKDMTDENDGNNIEF